MVKIRLDRLVTDTSQRLYGLSALIDLIDEAHPKVWEQGQKGLKEWAENKHWDYEDYNLEAQFLEANFAHRLPKEGSPRSPFGRAQSDFQSRGVPDRATNEEQESNTHFFADNRGRGPHSTTFGKRGWKSG